MNQPDLAGMPALIISGAVDFHDFEHAQVVYNYMTSFGNCFCKLMPSSGGLNWTKSFRQLAVFPKNKSRFYLDRLLIQDKSEELIRVHMVKIRAFIKQYERLMETEIVVRYKML